MPHHGAIQRKESIDLSGGKDGKPGNERRRFRHVPFRALHPVVWPKAQPELQVNCHDLHFGKEVDICRSSQVPTSRCTSTCFSFVQCAHQGLWMIVICSSSTCEWSGNRRSELSTFLTLWLSLTSMSNFSSGFRCSDGPFRSVYARSPKTRGEKLVIWRRPWRRLVVGVSDSSWEDVERLPETFFELLNLQGRALNEFTCVTWFLIVYNL